MANKQQWRHDRRVEPMTIKRDDYIQAVPYLGYTCGLLKRQAFGQNCSLSRRTGACPSRLSPGDNHVGDGATEIAIPRQVAEKVLIADARTESGLKLMQLRLESQEFHRHGLRMLQDTGATQSQ